MEHTYTIQGTYGSQQTPCDIFVFEQHDGSKWYCTEDSINVHCTYDDLEQGVDVETTNDHNFFTNDTPINSESELITAVES